MKRFIYVVMIVLIVSSLAVADTGVKKVKAPLKHLAKVSVVQFQSDQNEVPNPSIILRIQKVIKLFGFKKVF